jgi:hypothetical protein
MLSTRTEKLNRVLGSSHGKLLKYFLMQEIDIFWRNRFKEYFQEGGEFT